MAIRLGCSQPAPLTGGSEGLAMLNRTNRTQSAKTLGLNLGTRKLAAKAGANFGNSTLRFAARPDAARVGRLDVRDSRWLNSIVIRSYPPMSMLMPTPRLTGSSSHPQPSSHRGCGAGHSGQIAVLAPPISATPVLQGSDRRERSQVRPRPRRLGVAQRPDARSVAMRRAFGG